MSSCGCETPAPPPDIPIADPSCPCGLPEAIEASARYARETCERLSRLWPYSEMYGPILRDLERDDPPPRARRSHRRGTPSIPPAFLDGPDPEPVEGAWEPPKRLYDAPNGVPAGTDTGCEGWLYLGIAAPLLDPLGGTIAGCVLERYLGWWLNTTSPGTLRLGRTRTRIYFHNGSLQSEDQSYGFPVSIRQGDQNGQASKVDKFAFRAHLKTGVAVWAKEAYS